PRARRRSIFGGPTSRSASPTFARAPRGASVALPREVRRSLPDLRLVPSDPPRRALARERRTPLSKRGNEFMGIKFRLLGCAASSVGALLGPPSYAQPAVEEVRVVGTPHDRSPTEVAQS